MGGANEKGVYNWVTALPIAAHGFVLHKSAFRYALCHHCSWTPADLPKACVCGTTLTSHAQPKGVTIIRHNEVCDLTAIRLAEVWQGMSQISPTTTFRSDTVYKQCHNWAQCKARCCSKWLNSGEKDLIWEGGLFDIRVFNPYVPLNRNLPKLPMYYHCHETQIVSSMCCFQETYSIAREVAM